MGTTTLRGVPATRVAPEDILVFVGPTLEREAAEQVLPARYLPPAACGDVLRSLRLEPRVVAIIDGVFEHTGAVWHKEILLAMEAGVAVFGAASMGALRAAELAVFGMIGVGRIFEAYRDGVWTDDDEVAVLHASASGQYRALSEPLVNIRATVARAVAEGVITAEVGARVIASARATFYPERSLKSAAEKARAQGMDRDQLNRLLAFVERGGYVDQKALDARELLGGLAGRELSAGNGRAGERWVSRSSLLRTLVTYVASTPFGHTPQWLPPRERFALEITSLGPTHRLLCDLARLLALADAVARTRNLEPGPEATERLFDHDDFGLGPEARDPGWAASHDLDEHELGAFLHRLARIRALVNEGASARASGRGWRKYLLTLLRIHDEYEGYRAASRGSRASRDEAILRTLKRRDREKFVLFRRLAKLWCVVDRAARARGVGVDASADDFGDFADEFRDGRGLETRLATLAWLRRNNLDVAAFVELVTAWIRLRALFDTVQTDTLGLVDIADDVCWIHDTCLLTGFRARLEPSGSHPGRTTATSGQQASSGRGTRASRGDGPPGVPLRGACARTSRRSGRPRR